MKKGYLICLFAGLIAVLSVNHAFAYDIRGLVKAGIDFNGEQEMSSSGSSASIDVESGLSIAGEAFTELNESLEIGGGAIYQLGRKLDGYSDEFSFMPLYGMIRFKGNIDPVVAFGTAQLGYNLFFGNSDYKSGGDLEGGMYFGIGGGVIFQNNILVELLYSKNNGEVSFDGQSVDIENSQFTINLGYRF